MTAAFTPIGGGHVNLVEPGEGGDTFNSSTDFLEWYPTILGLRAGL